MLQRLPGHRITELIELLLDRFEIAARCFLSVAGGLGRRRRCIITAHAAQHGPQQRVDDHRQQRQQEQQGWPHQPSGQPVAQLPDQAVDRLQHQREHNDQQQHTAEQQPEARATHEAASSAVLPRPAVRMMSAHSWAANTLLLPVGLLSSLPNQMPMTQSRLGS